MNVLALLMQVPAITEKDFYNHHSSRNSIGLDLIQGSPQLPYHSKAPNPLIAADSCTRP